MRLASAAALAALAVLALGAGSPPAAPLGLTGAIVFELDPGSGSDIYVWVATAPKSVAPLVATPEPEFDAALSRDGRVVFVRAEGKQSELFLWESGKTRQLTRDGAIAQQPTWSPSGDRIVYARDTGNGADIMELVVDESSPRPVAPAPGDDLTPSYAPDGRIAFVSDRSGRLDLYVVTPDGDLTQMTRGRAAELSPVWSPDGSRIAFTRVAGGNADIWLMEVATGRLTRLTSHAADDSDPWFSPEGDRVVFVSDRAGLPSLWTIPARHGAKATRLVRRPGVMLGPIWSPTAPAAPALRTLASSAAFTITCPASGPFAGTASSDDISGSGANDTICGLGGNDKLQGRGGNDRLAGGAGADKVYGGNLADPIVSGGQGRDMLFGGYGADKLFARDGVVDVIQGGPGFDRAQLDGSPADVRVEVNGARSVEAVIG